MFRMILIMCIFLVTTLSCSPTKPPTKKGSGAKTSLKSTDEKNLKETDSDFENQDEEEDSDSGKKADPQNPTPYKRSAQVDGSSLKLSNISIGNLQSGGFKKQQIVNFSASAGTEYVEWKLCPQEESSENPPCSDAPDSPCGPGGACAWNVTSYNKIIFPNLYAGRVVLSMRACVDPSNAVSPLEPCGKFFDTEHDSKITNKEVSGLFARRQVLLEAFHQIGKEKIQIFNEYKGDLLECMSFNAKNAALYQQKISFIEDVVNQVFFEMWLGPIGDAMDAFAESAIGKPLADGIDAFGEAAGDLRDKFCALGSESKIDEDCIKNLGKIQESAEKPLTESEMNEYCTVGTEGGVAGKICSAIATVGNLAGGLIEGLNPAEAIPALSNAIYTLSDPESSVSRDCLAEQKLSKQLEFIDKEAAILSDEFLKITNQLKDLGEL